MHYQITDSSEYSGYAPGFVIELLNYWNSDTLHYAIPDWEERGMADLAGVFQTREAAQKALCDGGYTV